MDPCPDSLADRLRDHGLRPTRQRLALAALLFGDGNRHVTAERLHRDALRAGASVSLATVYNTLNQFRDAGLLHEVAVCGGTWFDTNTAPHHHLFHEDTGSLEDLPGTLPSSVLPCLPEGVQLSRVDLVLRVRGT